MTDPGLTGRKALVTGGAQGLGEEMARALAAAGAAVVVADVHDERGSKVAESFGAGHGYAHLDVSDDANWEGVMTQAVEHLGGLDVVVNNAGVEISGLVADLDPAEVRTMLDVNVLGTALGIKHAFRAMRPGGIAGNGGAVINIASVAGTSACPEMSVYSATKSAVDRLTRVAAMESGQLGYGVRVNCIYAGLTPTAIGAGPTDHVARRTLRTPERSGGAVIELTRPGRVGTVEDLADAVVFLASDRSTFVNGVGLPVNGAVGG